MDIEKLIQKFIVAKENEVIATVARIALGDEVARELGYPTEGSKTHEVGNYKVTVKGVMNRKANLDAIDGLGLVNPPIKTKRELDVVGLRWYQDNEPETYKRIAEHITATPGRVQVEVKNNV